MTLSAQLLKLHSAFKNFHNQIQWRSMLSQKGLDISEETFFILFYSQLLHLSFLMEDIERLINLPTNEFSFVSNISYRILTYCECFYIKAKTTVECIRRINNHVFPGIFGSALGNNIVWSKNINDIRNHFIVHISDKVKKSMFEPKYVISLQTTSDDGPKLSPQCSIVIDNERIFDRGVYQNCSDFLEYLNSIYAHANLWLDNNPDFKRPL